MHLTLFACHHIDIFHQSICFYCKAPSEHVFATFFSKKINEHLLVSARKQRSTPASWQGGVACKTLICKRENLTGQIQGFAFVICEHAVRSLEKVPPLVQGVTHIKAVGGKLTKSDDLSKPNWVSTGGSGRMSGLYGIHSRCSTNQPVCVCVRKCVNDIWFSPSKISTHTWDDDEITRGREG